MNQYNGPATTACLKQNEKYRFSSLRRSSGEEGDFISLARELSIEWHHIYFTLYVVKKWGVGEPYLLWWLVVHILQQGSSGHLRCDLNEIESSSLQWLGLDKEFFNGSEGEYGAKCEHIEELRGDLSLSWEALVEENPKLFASAQDHSIFIPAGKGIIYLRKNLKLERELLEKILSMADLRETPPIIIDDNSPESLLEELNSHREFPLGEECGDLLKLVLGRRLLLLSGGPGTGKTTTVTSLLRMIKLVGDRVEKFPLKRIILAAPTGRAANRMIESIRQEMEMNPFQQVDSSLPHTASTIHKLLGIRPGRKELRYNSENPLPADLLILDEASMIDARTMNLLFKALGPDSRVLLVGDKDQLPSVDAGAVFTDLVAGAQIKGGGIEGSLVTLTKSWRSNRSILDLASSIIRGDGEEALDILEREEPLLGGEIPPLESLIERLFKKYSLQRFQRIRSFPPLKEGENLHKEKVEEIFKIYESFALLLPSNKGTYGVENLNKEMNRRVNGQDKGLYHGQPIMIRTNDYTLSLFNGDRGVILNFGGEFFALFRNGPEQFRYISAGKLRSFETAYGQTIHKSQGSEFDEVMVLIPEGAERLLSREIVYTGVTRAKYRLELYSSKAVLFSALEKKVVRHSGFKDALKRGLDE